MLGLGLGFGKLSSYKYTVKKLIDDYIKRVTAAGGYLEGNECATAKVRELNSQRLLDDASWLLIPEGIKEDVVYAQKPTNGLGDLQFTRASDATRTNSAGVIERTPWNLFPNSEMFSAWTMQNGSIGVNVALSPIGTLTADKLIPDATTAQHRILQILNFTGPGVLSVYAKADGYNFLSLGTGGGVSGSSIYFNLLNGTVSGTASGFTASIENAGNGWYRCSIQSATLGAGINLSYWIIARQAATTADYAGNGTSGVLIWGAQLVEDTDAKPYFATTNRQDVPRLDYRNADGSLNSCPRLLLEPQRTNSIRNSTMVGAVAGSPGTLPTNWGISSAGLTRTIVGIGTENGLQYIDLRFNGTATAVFSEINTEGLISASAAQSWSNSTYAKVIAAPTPPNSYNVMTVSRGSSTNIYTQPFTPTSTLSRFSQVITTPAGATSVQPYLSFGLTLATSYDFTIRIAAPQMELGAYATTFIPTTTAAVTRIVDIFTRTNVFTNGLISAAGGTWFIDLANLELGVGYTQAQTLGIGNDVVGATANNIWLQASSPSNRIAVFKQIAGNISALYFGTSARSKLAIKWDGANLNVFENGVKVVTNSAFTTTQLQTLRTATVTHPYNINQSALFPTPLTDAQLVDLTGGRIYYNPVEAYYAYYLTPEIPSAVITSVNSLF